MTRECVSSAGTEVQHLGVRVRPSPPQPPRPPCPDADNKGHCQNQLRSAGVDTVSSMAEVPASVCTRSAPLGLRPGIEPGEAEPGLTPAFPRPAQAGSAASEFKQSLQSQSGGHQMGLSLLRGPGNPISSNHKVRNFGVLPHKMGNRKAY